MSHVSCKCKQCNDNFDVLAKDIKRGRGQFCSRSCSASFHNVLKSQDLNMKCDFCDKLFHRPERLRQRSKSGFVFCCSGHKCEAQNSDNPKFDSMRPDHYKTSNRVTGSSVKAYRRKALKFYGEKCQTCGYDKFPQILHVHHKDCNRTNNSIENLTVLCPNCHAETHVKNDSGSP